jgi:hypothetical protein
MKRLLTLMLLLVLAFSLLPEGASAATLSVEPVKEFTFKNPDAEALVFTITNTSKWDLDVTVEVYDQVARQNVQTITFPLLKGDAPYPVNAYVYKKMTKDSEVNTYRYTIKSAGTTTHLYYAQRLRISGPSDKLIHTYTQFTNTNYPNNTVSSFGPHFREVTPELTDKWYMFTPIDLSLQGRQTFILAASNIYKVGEVYVDVNQDMVNVSYHLFHEEEQGFTTERLSEFLTFYNSYADVGIVEPEEMPLPSNFAFNQPFSIQGMLAGDTNVLMFIRNRISYYRFPAPKSEYIRFWENLDEYKAQREGMLLMMDPIPNVAK